MILNLKLPPLPFTFCSYVFMPVQVHIHFIDTLFVLNNCTIFCGLWSKVLTSRRNDWEFYAWHPSRRVPAVFSLGFVPICITSTRSARPPCGRGTQRTGGSSRARGQPCGGTQQSGRYGPICPHDSPSRSLCCSLSYYCLCIQFNKCSGTTVSFTASRMKLFKGCNHLWGSKWEHNSKKIHKMHNRHGGNYCVCRCVFSAAQPLGHVLHYLVGRHTAYLPYSVLHWYVI